MEKALSTSLQTAHIVLWRMKTFRQLELQEQKETRLQGAKMETKQNKTRNKNLEPLQSYGAMGHPGPVLMEVRRANESSPV